MLKVVLNKLIPKLKKEKIVFIIFIFIYNYIYKLNYKFFSLKIFIIYNLKPNI